MNLLIDIGNSRIKWLVHDNVANKYGLSGAMAHRQQGLEELISEQLINEQWQEVVRPDRVLIANVASLKVAECIAAWIENKWQIEVEYAETEAFSHGVYNGYEDYSTLGVDRWMAIIAVWQSYQNDNKAMCIVDCGTATTIDAISESGQHLGGLIFPGYITMHELLVRNTSNIKPVQAAIPAVNFSKTTGEGVNSGCYLATIATIDRAINTMMDEYDKQVICIITGGNAELFINQLAAEFKYEPNLVLHGLAVFSGEPQ